MTQEQEHPPDPIGSELVKEDPAFSEIVAQFVAGLSGHVHVMESALKRADFEALRHSAHQLKGSGGGYGYPKLTDQAGALERYAAAHSFDECIEALEDLKNLCARVVPNAAD